MVKFFFQSSLMLATALVSFVPETMCAQAYQRLAPKILSTSSSSSATVATPTESAPLPSSDTNIISNLKGIIFVAHVDAIHASGVSSVTQGVMVQDLPLLHEGSFQQKVQPFLGKPVSISKLNAIAKSVNDFYAGHGRPFVYVSIPPQNISTGIVQMVVTEYRLGEIKVSGNQWFSSSLLTEESGLHPGELLDFPRIQSGLDRLNANAFRTVNTLFVPGAALGTTDLILKTQDRMPLHVYGSYDNAGVPSLGASEWALGGSWGNVAGLDQTLSYQFTHSVSDLYSGHAVSWTAPLPWHDCVQIFGSYSYEHPQYGAYGSYFTQAGHSGQASIRYIHNLPMLNWGKYLKITHDLQVGYDFKTTNNSLEFGGVHVFGSTADVNQFPIIYDAVIRDNYGQTSFSNTLVLSPGGLTGGNHRENFQTLVPGASTRYIYNMFSLARNTQLPVGFSWLFQAQGQVASSNLMYSNQLALGGLYAARGYATDTALGSQGVSLTNEVRFPVFSIWGGAGDGLQDQERVGVFYDYGHTSQRHNIPQSVNVFDLSSVGLDLNSTVGHYMSLTFNVGWRLHGVPVLRDENGFGGKGGFGNFIVTVGY
nr:ShlB/FhaC/HecB family hemolysin secretion/activation protein [uncultured Neokomagataea sp.]